MGETIRLILTILQVIFCVALVVTVIFQPGSDGQTAAMGGAGTFFGKNKSRGIEAKLEKGTVICAIVLAVITIVLSVF